MRNILDSNKKGQLGGLQGIILVIVVVGILLGAGFFIMEEFLDQAESISGSNTSTSYQELH